jgi:hypothetical protein
MLEYLLFHLAFSYSWNNDEIIGIDDEIIGIGYNA